MRISRRCELCPQESEHQPRLIGYPNHSLSRMAKAFTLSMLDATGVVTRVVSFSPFVPFTCNFPSMSQRMTVDERLPEER
jgi:hypothetical protein